MSLGGLNVLNLPATAWGGGDFRESKSDLSNWNFLVVVYTLPIVLYQRLHYFINTNYAAVRESANINDMIAYL